MTTIHEIQQQLVAALKAEQAAIVADSAAQTAYNEAFAAVEAQFRRDNRPLVDAVMDASYALEGAKQRVKELEAQAREMLTGAKVEDLPVGFEQTRDKQLSITDAAALRTWVQANMPAFLIVNDKALLKTVADALVEDKKAGTFTLSDTFAAAPIKFELSYKPRISLATLLKL